MGAAVKCGREHFSLRYDDADADGGVGACAVECLGAVAGAMGADFCAILEVAAPMINAALTAPHTHPTPHLYALAATAATLVGDATLAMGVAARA